MLRQLVTYSESSESEDDSGNLKSVVFAVDPEVWNAVRKLVADVCEHLGEPGSGKICPFVVTKYRDVISDSSVESSSDSDFSDSENLTKLCQRAKPKVKDSSSSEDEDTFGK